ncbi:hypothetical protein ABN20_003045 [Salmonella enterica subsp. enterica]|nr:hypothetical protein [Salmonella enterica subsp. enterica]
MVAYETIYGVHENQSVKRSGQAGGAARGIARNKDCKRCRQVLIMRKVLLSFSRY